MSGLSTLASFDDIRRCIHVLTDGTAEEEFLKVLQMQDKFRLECAAAALEAQRIQKELDVSLQNMADLEAKLFHARRLLEVESRARREAENDRDQMEKKIIAVADLLRNDHDINEQTKDKLAFLNMYRHKKRKSLNPHLEEKFGNDINSTGSFLSDLSLTQSEEDFLDVRNASTWHKHRPSLPKTAGPFVGAKRSRLSSSKVVSTPPRRSGATKNNVLELGINEKICATTKVTIPQDSKTPIRAESVIEAVPMPAAEEGVRSTPQRRSSNGRVQQQNRQIQQVAPGVYEAHQLSTVSPTLKTIGIAREHNFAPKTFIRSEKCDHCRKKIRFGSLALKCRDCLICRHNDCRTAQTTACVPQSATPTMKGGMGYISDYAPTSAPRIPALIIHCVSEIENRGLTELGLYRASGSEREIKALKERFLRVKATPHLADIDIHVLCGCIKDFLRSLREPLIPMAQWKDFRDAAQDSDKEFGRKNLRKAIDALPQANRDTLAFLILHFQRVAESPEVRMPSENICRVFGPTIVGYSAAEPDQQALYVETMIQFRIMEDLMKLSTDFWTRFVAPDLNKENVLSIQQHTPQNDEPFFAYRTPLKGTVKKRKFITTSPYPMKK